MTFQPSVFLCHIKHSKVGGQKLLTGVTAIEEGGGAPTAGQEGEGRRHEPLYDAALPWAQAQAAG